MKAQVIALIAENKSLNSEVKDLTKQLLSAHVAENKHMTLALQLYSLSLPLLKSFSVSVLLSTLMYLVFPVGSVCYGSLLYFLLCNVYDVHPFEL